MDCDKPLDTSEYSFILKLKSGYLLNTEHSAFAVWRQSDFQYPVLNTVKVVISGTSGARGCQVS